MPGTPLRGGSCTAPPASHTGSLRLARAAESTPQDEAAAAGQGWVCGPRSAGGYGRGCRLEEEEGGAAGLSPGLLEAGTHLWLACAGEGNRTRGDTQTFGGHVWVDGNAIYEGGRPGELGASSRGTHGPGAQAGPTVRQPGLGRAEAMWPRAEGALFCEETDEPLNGVTCPKAQSGLAHSHHAPPAPQAPPGAGVTDTDRGSQTAVSATVSSLPLFPRLCKGSPLPPPPPGLGRRGLSSALQRPFPEGPDLEVTLCPSRPALASGSSWCPVPRSLRDCRSPDSVRPLGQVWGLRGHFREMRL